LTHPDLFDALRTEDLLTRVKSGDQDAWREIYRRYRTFLLVAARQMAGTSYEDAEDVVQSGFLRAWSDLEGFTYQGTGSLRAWLRSVVVNRNLSKLRKLNREYSASDDDSARTGLLERAPDPRSQDPLEFVAQQEDEARLIQCMERELEPEEQELLMLRHFERLPMSQIADIMEQSGRTLHRKHAAAMERLQRALGGTA
jgi:RNA polymerase sigma-70 factor, ECF subfamily